ncbi:MAG: ABC transporter permease [Hahellaceae bacterium]|nr:ABC transporter permease [Hahellaceae bacterium]
MTKTISQFSCHANGRQFQIDLLGSWDKENGVPQALSVFAKIPAGTNKLLVSGEQLGAWDSSLVSFLLQIHLEAERRHWQVEYQRVPQGVGQLLQLALAVPESRVPHQEPPHTFAENLGFQSIVIWRVVNDFISFIGELTAASGRFWRGQARYRKVDFWWLVQDAGPHSLPIVTLISLLIGMILAFVGAVQLERFGASIFVANLVGLAMAREMSSMMTAIIMAGRTGAAYAAQLGSMQVNEEIDGLKTMGVSPMEFLVIPRMLALVLMMPLLTIYANLMGMLGGAIVSITMLDVSWSQFVGQLVGSVSLKHFVIGLVKSVLFAVVVAMSGCFTGLRSARSATAVGQATTSAVVLGIVLIIVTDSLVTIATTILDI